MNTINNGIGLFGCLLLITALPLMLIRRPRFSRRMVFFVIAMMIFVAVIPVNGLIVIAYLRGVVSDLSITSMILLACFIATAYSGRPYIQDRDMGQLGALVILSALIVYPFGLGLGPWDSYALGYGNLWLYSALLIIVLYCYIRLHLLLMTILLAGCIAYLLSLLASQNLWDYLIDPLLVFYTAGWLLFQTIKKKRKQEAV